MTDHRNAAARRAAASLCIAAACWSSLACAAGEGEDPLESVQITATREPEPVVQVPASISIVTGEELRARGVSDLRTALSLAVGVEGTPGGDAGPAGSVPALWGLREVDAFLLVVDGIPWGGAFNPATPSLDLYGIERIEVLRGPAPVMFGATAFSGVIHVIHHAPGQVQTEVSAMGGSYGSFGAAGMTNLPAIGSYRQSLSADLERAGSADDRTEFTRYHALYRGAGQVGGNTLHLDADVSVLPQEPAGNLLLRNGPDLHTELPIHANYNPSGAKLNQQRYQLAVGLDGDSVLGAWSTKLAVTRTLNDVLRGFLRGDAFSDPPDAGVGDGFQADGYTQTSTLTDVYFDAHVNRDLLPSLNLTYGADYMYGDGAQHAVNFGYCIDEAGNEYACDGAHHPDELVQSDDHRNFSGLYAQVDWKLAANFDVLAGLRLNHTSESANGQETDNTGPAPVVVFAGGDSSTHTRLSGMIGASWKTWTSGANALTWYADYRNSFKPLAVDFGPEAEVDVLEPETANSYEAGAKLQLLDGRLDADASVFRMDFSNGLTFADDGNGNFGPANGGKTRFMGYEVEARYALNTRLQLAAHYAFHDAHFVSYTLDNGSDVSGNRVEMSPRQLGGMGLVYADPSGLNGSLVANFVSNRMLNKRNTVKTGGYSTLDAALGYRFSRYNLQLVGYNLTNRRDPVAESELSEVVTVTGTAGYYRLPARAWSLRITYTPG